MDRFHPKMGFLHSDQISRRAFLGAAAFPWLGSLSGFAAEPPARRLRVACVYTVLRFRSHAFNFLENFLQPYLFNGKGVDPGMDVASFFADQRVPEGDMTDQVSKKYRVPVFKNIEGALTLGGKNLAVDAVLLIGEHGEYPVNKLAQREYPRKQFFDEIVRVMRRSDRFVPIFNDKHLSYRWEWAREMFDTARKHRIPFMAGSSVPLAQRRPELELPAGAAIEEAVSIHGGGLETYDFHGLEILQSLVEARKGGETGVASVVFLEGEALARELGKKNWAALVSRALAAENLEQAKLFEAKKQRPTHGLLVNYRDGLKGLVLKWSASTIRWNFACKLGGLGDDKNLRATSFYVGPWGNRNLFMALSHAIQHLFRTGREPYPVERTLLTTGILEAAMRSRIQEGKRLDTPHLQIAYKPVDFRTFREMGASWKIVAGKVEDKGFHTLGR